MLKHVINGRKAILKITKSKVELRDQIYAAEKIVDEQSYLGKPRKFPDFFLNQEVTYQNLLPSFFSVLQFFS